uniref:Glycosyltransferase n=1 Tax=Elaeis guineensis var. tenera TaxID=51953 RepID=A0A6I9R370_ELAGV|nr:UDP-glycosyltransferase 92A1 [Elaeis guineensis]
MDREHLLLFPFMAQGHLIPFFNLAKLIEQRKRFAITIVNTPLNIAKLQSSLPPNSAIHLMELPFSSSEHGLPPNSENTDSLPLHLFTTFFQATETLRPAFEHLVSNIIQQQGHNRLCIVADMFFGWTVESAKKLGVFHSVFVTSGAYASAIIFSLWLHTPLLAESYDEVPLIDFPEVKIHHSQLINAIVSSDGMDPTTVFLRQQISLSFQSSELLLNTVEELEREGLRLLRNISRLPVWSIGPIASTVPSSDHISDSWMKFLDSNPPASVLYVSFGSQNAIPASQMMELALGLEAGGKPFIWVIRAPPREIEDGEDDRIVWLPEGFEDRITEKKQGFLVHGWAPQPEILSHPSTGAFLSHCGWNSVLESLSQGVPIIGWPLLGDQLFNSKMMEEEMGVCVEIARGRGADALRNGWKGVKEAIELVMGGTEEGREMRRKASKIREMMAGALKGSSFKAMENFLETAFSTTMNDLK